MVASNRKVVVVTGSSKGGIGYSVVMAFAEQGCIVYATARNLASLESLPASVHQIQLDVTSKEACESAIASVLEKEGKIDILVNNAGGGAAGPACEFDIEDAKACFDINLFAPMRLTQLVVPSMAKQRSGLIINIGSVVGLVPTPWAGVYAASKAAIGSWSETLRMECKGLGVNVMLVCPGAITSGFGIKQESSIKMKPDSLFLSVKHKIEERAQLSQRPDHSLPSAILAQGIVERALRPTPAYFYTAGGKAWLFWLLERLPRPLVWWLLRRSTGCEGVGK